MSNERYSLIGTGGSPYSMKLRAIMRYRHISHNWIHRTTKNSDMVAHVKPNIIPMLRYPDEDQYRVDSTPLAYALEDRHPGYRSIIPDDPGHAFLSHLLEDMADEWLTKAMFHYRWYYDADIHYASHWIADDGFPESRGDMRDEVAKSFADRQISRMPMVGCTPKNKPVIEDSFHRILTLMECHVSMHDFLFGTRPSLGDFGIFGQLKPLSTDPTPLAIMRAEAMKTESWVRQLDDASGIEGKWLSPEDDLPDATMGLLELTGEFYMPFLLANAAAAEKGKDTFSLTYANGSYSQATFNYQVKCLMELRRRFAELEGEAAIRTRAILQNTGCLSALLQ